MPNQLISLSALGEDDILTVFLHPSVAPEESGETNQYAYHTRGATCQWWRLQEPKAPATFLRKLLHFSIGYVGLSANPRSKRGEDWPSVRSGQSMEPEIRWSINWSRYLHFRMLCHVYKNLSFTLSQKNKVAFYSIESILLSISRYILPCIFH